MSLPSEVELIARLELAIAATRRSNLRLQGVSAAQKKITQELRRATLELRTQQMKMTGEKSE